MMSSNGCPSFTLWFTGLPCSGKSTLASLTADWLRTLGRKVEVLDGDVLRRTLSRDLGFSQEDRNRQVERIGAIAHLLTRNGIDTLVAVVSAYREARDANRRLIENYIEVYVSCSVERCIERDCKGMYRKALAGEISHFTGVSDPYEPPIHPEIIVETDHLDPEASLRLIQSRLTKLGHLPDLSLQRK